jgi:predicted ATPase
VLDNCEHQLDTSTAVVGSVVRACPHVALLTTSRAPLGVAGEMRWRLPALSPPPDGVRDPCCALDRSDALRLFCERASGVQPGFSLRRENMRAVIAICHGVDGLPLAIELAAAQLPVMSVDEIADGLPDCLRLLHGGAKGRPARHRSLRSSLDWSHHLLDDDARTLLRRMAVFEGDARAASARTWRAVAAFNDTRSSTC